MPKQRITREMIVEAAFALAREAGLGHATVTAVAKRLKCSVQPIYSYCQSMEGLREEVTRRADGFIRQYLAQHVDPQDLFPSTGRAYTALAMEEPYLFQLFILKRRGGVGSFHELSRSYSDPEVPAAIAQKLGISLEKAKALHLNMLIYTVGIGTILATVTPGIPQEEVSGQLERAYEAFLRQTLESGINEGEDKRNEQSNSGDL